MPVEGLRCLIPGPVGLFGVNEYYACTRIFFVAIRPNIIVSRRRAGLGGTCPLEPRMLVGRMIDDEFNDNADAAPMRFVDKAPDVGHRTIIRMHVAVIRYIVTIIAAR